jgi:hypothetical protein
MWIQIVLGLIGLASAITSWLRDRKALNQAGADVVSQQLKAALNEIQTADKIRDAVRADLAANPGKLREPDSNSRD